MFGIEALAQSPRGRADGGGGDGEIPFSFQENAKQALDNTKRIAELNSLPSKRLFNLLASVKILVSDDILYVERNGIKQESTAVNYPKENTIIISKPLWSAIKSNIKKEALALHELLSLLGLESTGDYRYSQIYYDKLKPTVNVQYKDLMKPRVLNELEDPKVVITVFEDFTTAFVYLNNKILQKVIKQFSNKVQIVVRNRPNTLLYENSEATALAGICANDQGHFQTLRAKFLAEFERIGWHHDIFNQAHIRELLLSIPSMDMNKFDNCVKSPAAQMALDVDLHLNRELKIDGTPHMIVSSENETTRVIGVIPEAEWVTLINKMLSNLK